MATPPAPDAEAPPPGPFIRLRPRPFPPSPPTRAYAAAVAVASAAGFAATLWAATAFPPVVLAAAPLPAALFALYAVSFARAVLTPPGFPADYVPPCSEAERQAAVARARYAHAHGLHVVDIAFPARWCVACAAFKPARAFHCSACRRCVLGKDHHCAWIGQCVGEHNVKFFLLCLFYLAAVSALGIVVVFLSVSVVLLAPRTSAGAVLAVGARLALLVALAVAFSVAGVPLPD